MRPRALPVCLVPLGLQLFLFPGQLFGLLRFLGRPIGLQLCFPGLALRFLFGFVGLSLGFAAFFLCKFFWISRLLGNGDSGRRPRHAMDDGPALVRLAATSAHVAGSFMRRPRAEFPGVSAAVAEVRI